MLPVIPSNGPSGYQISRSVRLRSSAGGNFTRTPSVAGNRKLFTISAWLKRGALGTASDIMSATSGAGGTVAWFRFNSSDQLDYVEYNGASFAANAQSAAVFRDPSAWYHVVVAFDSAQATAANRLKVYVNNVLQTMSGTLPSLSLDSYFNSTGAHYIGREARSAIEFFDGYITEFNFVNGQALTPSSFGSTNATTGVWQPARYTGTYGTNGFYLNFSDNSAATAAAIGKDYSGNGNNWTPNNISVTAGVTYDSMIDVPTPYADGSTGRGNYAVFNPLAVTAVAATFAEGNLKVTTGLAGGNGYGTIAVPASGKWYWEVTAGSANNPMIGISAYLSTQAYAWQNGSSVFYYSSGQKYVDGTASAYGASYTTNDVIGVAVDVGAGTITFYKNNVSQGAITHAVTDLYPCLTDGASATTDTFYANFGQRPFTYTPPSGFAALNTYNLPASTITNGGKYMAATTYTGTLLSNSITNAGGFKPDLVWVKSRSAATDHKLTDSVRGVTKALISDTTGAETTDTQGLTSFNSNGFTVGTDTNYNNLSATYVGWQWQAGQGSTSSNTSGTITSTVSVNATAGFSIVTWTQTANGTVGHGLGVAPAMIIYKDRTTAGQSWIVYHKNANASPATGFLSLNQTSAFSTSASVFNNTAPTSTVFNCGSYNNNSDLVVAYCWSEIAGFSKFGSYTGNGSTDGPFVFLGFRPRWLLWKSAGTVQDWYLLDTSRDPYNQASLRLCPDLSNAELASSASYTDFLANGFKIRDADAAHNASGVTYIYAAFAENPFQNSLAR